MFEWASGNEGTAAILIREAKNKECSAIKTGKHQNYLNAQNASRNRSVKRCGLIKVKAISKRSKLANSQVKLVTQLHVHTNNYT